jgi:hypothetical protein
MKYNGRERESRREKAIAGWREASWRFLGKNIEDC